MEQEKYIGLDVHQATICRLSISENSSAGGRSGS